MIVNNSNKQSEIFVQEAMAFCDWMVSEGLVQEGELPFNRCRGIIKDYTRSINDRITFKDLLND